MSELDDRFVHKGFWINWSQGPVMGRTITTDAQTGNTVVAILTVLVTVASGQLWNLITFLYHQSRATSKSADGLFWQQQALMRTMPAPAAMLTDTIKLYWTWKQTSDRAFLRCLPQVVFSVCFIAIAIISGLFSSYVVDTSNLEVLINSPYCGQLNYTTLYMYQQSTNSLFANLFPAMETYARECYQNKTKLPARCQNIFIRPNVSFTANPVACPWEKSMCLDYTSLPAIEMDSGYVDFKKHLGYNLRDKDNVQLRKKTTCNVLPLDGHNQVRNASAWKNRFAKKQEPDQKIIAYQYGNWTAMTPEELPGDSFLLPLRVTGYLTEGLISYAMADPGIPGFVPIVPLRRSDADVALMAVRMNQVTYATPVDDPLFSAHRNLSYPSLSPDRETEVWYEADQASSFVGCAEQYQFCVGSSGESGRCTELSGLPGDFSPGGILNPNDVQLTLLNLLRSVLTLNDVSLGTAVEILQAKSMESNGRFMGLPEDQWIKEIVGWNAFAWSGIQTLLTDYAVGLKMRDEENADIYVDKPTTPAGKQLCQSVKMKKSGGFANINVFGLAFIVTVTVTVTAFNMMVLRVFIFLSRFRRALAPRIDHWVQDGIFQLQRRAFQSEGQGSWLGSEKEIPHTTKSEHLAKLPNGSTATIAIDAESPKPTPSSTFSDMTKTETNVAKTEVTSESKSIRE
ncbi:hypothetical protein BU24DRAFT_465061 [Aaosphaeria arxii CBS 175.79]|uniref:Uncharacterized protein n=1 Tax=Aaosphaeria arxii CBS 175.79 TaxID=1450172 RepID=A0A6A5XHE8_9PLEO|nr:uncharacterized protein BU24DRAFT_465061 [Aaosphaeria arxii CBS 175.79]KAF2012695.1 hypothetical protein BU24DRAFT_465061 [Aaosphaeria arxii CBS 175.79]